MCGRSLQTVNEGEYLILINAHIVPLSQSDAIDSTKQISEGMYYVSSGDPNHDIPAGTYTITPDENSESSDGYYVIFSDSRHTEDSVLSEGTVESGKSATVTLEEGQYIELYGCHMSINSDTQG